MTETEWLECTDPMLMLEWLGEEASERKLRLFASACCRRVWHLMTNELCQTAVEVAERFADGDAKLEEVLRSENALNSTDRRSFSGSVEYFASIAAYNLVGQETLGYHINEVTSDAQAAAAAAVCDPTEAVEWQEASRIEGVNQSHLIRDIFGNPFRPVTLDPRWQSSTVLDLARTIYDHRTFENMPILADALMDAGCDNEEIIQHCQGPGPHVRGCWVVDLLTGRV